MHLNQIKTEVILHLNYEDFLALQIILGYAHERACEGEQVKLCDYVKRVHSRLYRDMEECHPIFEQKKREMMQ